MAIVVRYKDGLNQILKSEQPAIGHPAPYLCAYRLDRFGMEEYHYHFKIRKHHVKSAFYEEIPVIKADGFFCKKEKRAQEK